MPLEWFARAESRPDNGHAPLAQMFARILKSAVDLNHLAQFKPGKNLRPIRTSVLPFLGAILWLCCNPRLGIAQRLKNPLFLIAITHRARVDADPMNPIVRKILRTLPPPGIEVVGPNVVKDPFLALFAFPEGTQLARVVSK